MIHHFFVIFLLAPGARLGIVGKARKNWDTVEPWLKITLIKRPPCYKDHFSVLLFSLERLLTSTENLPGELKSGLYGKVVSSGVPWWAYWRASFLRGVYNISHSPHSDKYFLKHTGANWVNELFCLVFRPSPSISYLIELTFILPPNLTWDCRGWANPGDMPLQPCD